MRFECGQGLKRVPVSVLETDPENSDLCYQNPAELLIWKYVNRPLSLIIRAASSRCLLYLLICWLAETVETRSVSLSCGDGWGAPAKDRCCVLGTRHRAGVWVTPTPKMWLTSVGRSSCGCRKWRGDATRRQQKATKQMYVTVQRSIRSYPPRTLGLRRRRRHICLMVSKVQVAVAARLPWGPCAGNVIMRATRLIHLRPVSRRLPDTQRAGLWVLGDCAWL